MKHTTWLAISLLVSVTAAGCSKSAKADGIPCDDNSIAALAADLSKANGLNVDLGEAKVQAEITKAKAAITGKHLAFTGCTFQSQGNDEVAFGAATGKGPSIDCAMKGGEAGVKAFREAAMKIGLDKLKLDVSGTVALGGMKGFERLRLTDCEISAHD